MPKFEKNTINEDALFFNSKIMAVSDGAGGGGIYSDQWSAFLVHHIPDKIIHTTEQLNEWMDIIWEKFYIKYEEEAQKAGGMLLSKFYEEGSFATLAIAWLRKKYLYWITYGDSVIFKYDIDSDVLLHTFSQLKDFAGAPFLLNWKDKINNQGFQSGKYNIEPRSIYFLASDALAQYIIISYYLTHLENYRNEIEKTLDTHSKLSGLIKLMQSYCQQNHPDFYRDIISPLVNSLWSGKQFRQYIHRLYQQGVLAADDYTLVVYDDLK